MRGSENEGVLVADEPTYEVEGPQAISSRDPVVHAVPLHKP